MDQFTRSIIGFGAHAGKVDGVALCRLFNTAISTRGIPYHLSSDNDPLFWYLRGSKFSEIEIELLSSDLAVLEQDVSGVQSNHPLGV